MLTQLGKQLFLDFWAHKNLIIDYVTFPKKEISFLERCSKSQMEREKNQWCLHNIT